MRRLLAFTLLLAACGGDNQEATETINENPTTEVVTDVAADEPMPAEEAVPTEEPPMPHEEHMPQGDPHMHQGPHQGDNPPMDIPVMPIPHNYFLKNTVKLDNGINCIVVRNKSNFNKYFGVGVANGEHVEPIDFNGHFVVAIAMQTKKMTDMIIERAELENGTLKLICMVHQHQEQNSHESTPIAMAAVPKDQEIKKISFYSQDRLLKTVNY